MRRVPRPPQFAKALMDKFQDMRRFMDRFDPKDPEQKKRFYNRLEDIKFAVSDMEKANVRASNPDQGIGKDAPMVMVPHGLWSGILGEQAEDVEDGTWMPLNQPDGPMTWKK